jgi:hypothetical protein
LSGCYELGGERIGVGTGAQPHGGGEREGSGRHDTLTNRGRRPGTARARQRRAVVGRATPSSGVERGGGFGLMGHGLR